MLVVLMLTAGEEAQAVKELESVLARDPDNKSAQMYLRIAQGYGRKSQA